MSSRSGIPVLVTGAGSELAYGIIKACRMSRVRLTVIGCDCDSNALGLRWVDRPFVVPRADRQPNAYIDALRELIKSECIK